MGKYDRCMKAYLQDKRRFADLFNGSCFQGRQVIRAEDLEEASESYDAAEYSRQLKERKQERRLLARHKEESGKELKTTIDERLSGILRSDRLHPVYTICLYSGEEPWDGPRKLSDMMEFDPEDENLRVLFEEYHLHLFCINEQNGFDTFHSGLKQLFCAMNCRKDKERMAELMKNEAYAHLSKETWEAIAVMTDNAAMLQKKDKYKTENGKEEEYNMCQALEELMEDNRNEGRREGRNEGRNEGSLEKTKTVVRNMLDRGYEIEDICAIAGCEASFVEEVKKDLI